MRFEWDDGGIPKRIAKLDKETRMGIRACFDFQAPRSMAYMKTMAPWSDQTTNARNGLHAFSHHSGNRSELLLAHAVSYGIYLEVCNSGRYAIILPALRRAGEELKQLIDGLWKEI